MMLRRYNNSVVDTQPAISNVYMAISRLLKCMCQPSVRYSHKE